MADVIFVVGYYRSGTSGLSGALHKLGVEMHSEASKNEHNVYGFYEIPELISYDVELLHKLGAEWTDVRGLPENWVERADIAPFVSRLDGMLRRRFPDTAKIWAVKHPHMCHLLPAYEKAVRLAGHTPHVIHIYRDPASSAASQKLKNGLSRTHALLLWLSYATAAEMNARHLPRSWLTYGDLLTNPAEQFLKIEGDLKLPITKLRPNGVAEATAHITEELNRSAPLSEEGLFPPLRNLVNRTWGAILGSDYRPDVWDGLRAETSDLVNFLEEVSESRARTLPGFAGNPIVAAAPPAFMFRNALRPPERLDDGGKRRLDKILAAADALPSVAVVIIAPPGRAHNVVETLETLKGQWYQPNLVHVVSAEPITIDIDGVQVSNCGKEPGDITVASCGVMNDLAERYDYVASICAGDKIDPDAVMRFGLASEGGSADMIYCDEVVPNETGPWVRYKPGWDITRLRQSPYIGDWVWYRGKTLLALGGLNRNFAGAEDYDLQLRMALTPHKIVRLSEALFIRGAHTIRDAIPKEQFGAKALEALCVHLEAAGIPAVVENRKHVALFYHSRVPKDPGTSTVMICDGADLGSVQQWMQNLLLDSLVTGPIILIGTDLQQPVRAYFEGIAAKPEEFAGKIIAIVPSSGMTKAEAFRAAFDMVETEHVAIVSVRGMPMAQDWLNQLRSKIVDEGVVLVGAKALMPLAAGVKQVVIQGPIVIGASSRLGAGHFSDSPGPGGWLMVDQEASAVAPSALLAVSSKMKGCIFSDLPGDAFWIDVCAQLRADGSRIVWTPDAALVVSPDSIDLDVVARFREGSDAARALPWQDPYHHPAFSTEGDILAPEMRMGLYPSYPPSDYSVLFSGSTDAAESLTAAARAFRATGEVEASWSSEPLTAGEVGRRGATHWIRVNPTVEAVKHTQDFTAVFTKVPENNCAAILTQARQIFGTSPGIVSSLQKDIQQSKKVALWRPSLTRSIWEGLTIGTGLNTKPRVLWFDEGNAPSWFQAFVNETAKDLAWIVVERQGVTYSGAISRIRRHGDEQGWANELAQIAPQILVRPAAADASADRYFTLLAAASGALILADKRLDTPHEIKARRLPNIAEPWKLAISEAVNDLKGTLEAGKKAREAVLAMPSVEELPVPWSGTSTNGYAAFRTAAE